MSKRDKLFRRFLSKPKDFTFDEVRALLGRQGYREIAAGTASGSRVAFVHPADGHVIRLHKPHPVDILKRYQLDEIESTLRGKGRLR